MARFPIRPASPNPRVRTDEDNTLAVYGDLQYLYDYIISNNGGGGGTSAIVWRGTWSAAATYAKDDAVYYNGSSYICTTAVGPSPTNPSVDTVNWDILALQGTTGQAGPAGANGAAGAQGPIGPSGADGAVGPAGLNWQSTWSNSTAYVVDDAVGYNGASWFCINPVGPSATPPDVDTVNWALLAAQGAIGPQGAQGIQGPPGPSGSGSLLIGNTVFVSKLGDDSTGAANNLSLPFLTIGAALAVAQIGYTIVVFPGDYELSDQLVLRDQINFQFIGVGTVTLLLSVKKYIFDDSASIGAVNCTIYAPNWKFEGRGSTNTDVTIFPTDYRGVSKGVLKLTKASTVDFTAREIIAADTPIYIEGDQAVAIYPYNSYAGAIVPKVKITAHTIRKTADFAPNNTLGSVIGAQFAQLEINATDIIQDDPWTSYDQGGIDFKFCEKMIINADRIINYGEDGQCLYMQDSGPLDKLYLDVNYMRSGDGWTIWTYSGTSGATNIEPQVYIRANRIDNAGDCCVVSSYTDLTIEGTTIYVDYVGIDGILHCEFGGKLTAIGCNILRAPTSSGGYDILASGSGPLAGKVYLLNTVFDKSKQLAITDATISIWNGTDYFQYKEISLSSAEISNLYSIPLTVLPALNTLPPYGINYYDIEKIIIEVKNYDPNITIQMTGDFELMLDQARFATVSRDLVENNRTGYVSITPSPNFIFLNVPQFTPTVSVSAIPSNRSLIFQAQNSNPTNVGTLTMKIKIWYKVSLF